MNTENGLFDWDARPETYWGPRISENRSEPNSEYLPPLLDNEVEIARIVLDNHQRDTQSIRASMHSDGIHYRIVDDFEGEYTCAIPSSVDPLSLKEVIWILDGSHAGISSQDDLSPGLIFPSWEYELTDAIESELNRSINSEELPALLRSLEAKKRQALVGRARNSTLIYSDFYPLLDAVYDLCAQSIAEQGTFPRNYSATDGLILNGESGSNGGTSS